MHKLSILQTGPSTFAQNLKSILLYKIIAALQNYVSMHSVSTSQFEGIYFSGGYFADPVKSHKCENGAYGRHQFGGWDMGLLLLLARCLLPCGVVYAPSSYFYWLFLIKIVPYGFLSHFPSPSILPTSSMC